MADNDWGTALAAAQGEMQNAPLNKINPHFKNRYADLAAIRDATIPALSKHGLAITQAPQFDNENGFYLETKLIYKGVAVDIGRYPLAMALDKPQLMGSSITYARRYSWSSMCGIASEEDDDAEASTSIKQKSAYKARKGGDYEQLIGEIEQQQTTADLRAWGIQNQHRVGEQPESYKEHLREHFSRRLKELGGNAGPPSTLREDLKKSLEIELTKEEAEELESVGVDVTTDDPQAFLDDLDSTMSGAADEVTVMEIWGEYGGIKDILPPAAQHQAETILEKHMRRAKADAAANHAQRMRESRKK